MLSVLWCLVFNQVQPPNSGVKNLPPHITQFFNLTFNNSQNIGFRRLSFIALTFFFQLSLTFDVSLLSSGFILRTTNLHLRLTEKYSPPPDASAVFHTDIWAPSRAWKVTKWLMSMWVIYYGLHIQELLTQSRNPFPSPEQIIKTPNREMPFERTVFHPRDM